MTREQAPNYQSKSAEAGRMGKAAELLVAAFCILRTRGRLNVSTSLIDDEGVDLVFHLRNSSATLAVQVKARMSDAAVVERGSFLADVRSQTFRPRDDLDMLFLVPDVSTGAIKVAWLVPSLDFAAVTTPNGRDKLRFVASQSATTRDQWSRFRYVADELPGRIVQRLTELGA